MNFGDLLRRAKSSDQQALEELLQLYRPLMMKEAIVDGILDEDLYQEIRIVFLRCIQQFDI